MPATLEAVSDYIAGARSLLKDLVAPYRYSDDDIVMSLNQAFYEIARIRPDILLDAIYTTRVLKSRSVSAQSIPSFSTASPSDIVVLPPPYRTPVLYYIVGSAQLKDTEDTQDERATIFLNKFTVQLLEIKA